MHRDQSLGADRRRQPRGLAFVEVPDDASGLPFGVTTVDRQEGNVRSERPDRGLHPLVVDRVPGVIDPDAVHLEHEPDEPDQPTGELLAEAVRIGHRDPVTGRNRANDDPVELVGLAGLDPEDALLRDPGLGNHLDDGRRHDERRARRCCRDRGGAGGIEMIDVLVRAEDEVDARCRGGRQRRLVPAALVR